MGVSRLLTTISCTQLPWWCIHLVHRNYTPKYCSKSYRWFFTPKVDETKNHISYGRSSSSLNMIQSQVLSHPQTTTTCDHHLHPASKGRVFSGSGRPMTWRISWVEKFWEKNDLQDADGVILITIYNLIIVEKIPITELPRRPGIQGKQLFLNAVALHWSPWTGHDSWRLSFVWNQSMVPQNPIVCLYCWKCIIIFHTKIAMRWNVRL
jgi:hypothetical protein